MKISNVFISDAVPVDPDAFRNEFDRMVVEWSHQKMWEAQHFLLRLTEQLVEFRKNPTKEEKDLMLVEMDKVLGDAMEIDRFFTKELKRTDLNEVERYTFQDGKYSSELLVKNLDETRKEIESIPV